jgi:hypothetical protein
VPSARTGRWSSRGPEVEWEDVSRRFVETLGLTWAPLTTQIEPHDWIAELFHSLARFNAILVDFDRDVWAYISRGLVRQRPVEGEVGSSTMPHKVNPIDFENSEANAGVGLRARAAHGDDLARLRLQRDLSDSSLLRNGGVVVGHSLLALRSALRGPRQDRGRRGGAGRRARGRVGGARRGGADRDAQARAARTPTTSSRRSRAARGSTATGCASSSPRPTSTRPTASGCSRSRRRSTPGLAERLVDRLRDASDGSPRRSTMFTRVPVATRTRAGIDWSFTRETRPLRKRRRDVSPSRQPAASSARRAEVRLRPSSRGTRQNAPGETTDRRAFTSNWSVELLLASLGSGVGSRRWR